MTWLRRAIIRLYIRRRTQQPQVYRFHADRWQHFRILVCAGQMNMQQLDSVALIYERQPTLLVMKTDVEGIRFWKVDSPAPAVNSTPLAPLRSLAPCEITTDFQWSQGSRPAVVFENDKTQDGAVDIFYATEEVDGDLAPPQDV